MQLQRSARTIRNENLRKNDTTDDAASDTSSRSSGQTTTIQILEGHLQTPSEGWPLGMLIDEESCATPAVMMMVMMMMMLMMMLIFKRLGRDSNLI